MDTGKVVWRKCLGKQGEADVPRHLDERDQDIEAGAGDAVEPPKALHEEHFGLAEQPFKITPVTSFFYSGANRGEILDALVYAITDGEGIVKVSGEVGSGKTMLCRMLLDRLPTNLKAIELEALADKWLASVADRVNALGEQLRKVETEIAGRDVKDLSTAQLYSLARTLRRQIVQTGIESGGDVEIVAGLTGEEEIIGMNASAFRDGQQVDVMGRDAR